MRLQKFVLFKLRNCQVRLKQRDEEGVRPFVLIIHNWGRKCMLSTDGINLGFGGRKLSLSATFLRSQ